MWLCGIYGNYKGGVGSCLGAASISSLPQYFGHRNDWRVWWEPMEAELFVQIVLSVWQIDGKFCKYLKFTSAWSTELARWHHSGTRWRKHNIKTKSARMGGVNAGLLWKHSESSISVRKEAECFRSSQRVVFDVEQCRYVFPVGTKDIHLKIRFFFFFFCSVQFQNQKRTSVSEQVDI